MEEPKKEIEKEKEEGKKLDDDLYSRSIFTYGLDTMKKLSTLKVFILGMRGLGIEVAKNIILNGCEEVSIYDQNIVKINDLGSNFYLSDDDVNKKRRDEACVDKLSELNPYVKVSILDIEQKEDMNEYINHFCSKIKKYNVVVITEYQPMQFISQIDAFCRTNKIKFIYGYCLGLVGYIFVDFGATHIIFDETGKETKTYLIKSISRDKKGTVVIDDVSGTNKLEIGTGHFVKFKDVGGMVELNDDKKEFVVELEDSTTFRIGDTSNFSEYTRGGTVYQIKKPVPKQYLDFNTRSVMISDVYHKFEIPDYTKCGRQELLFITQIGIHDYFIRHGNTLPELNNIEIAKEICQKVKQVYDITKAQIQIMPWFAEMQEFDEKIVMNVIRWSAANLQPICGFFGGIIAQEIIKSTGKYKPIDQWFIQDFLEIADNIKEDADRKLKNCRYDDQIAIFGNEIQDKIHKSNIFMVGAGATGCEFLKNFAMMGFCTDKNAKFVVTDNDNIEISNLTRQFLFRKKDVGKSKALIAIESATKMNPEFNGEGLQLLVDEKTENIFNEDFWEKQDFIVYAVDSVNARKYIDSKVVYFQKPAIDSGTLGTQAKSQIIIPHQTKTYQDTKVNTSTPNKIPQCTLRHFPSLIQHCIEWSREYFFGYFGDKINKIRLFFSDYNSFKEEIHKKGSPLNQLNVLKDLKIYIDMIVKKDLKEMCEYAVNEYTKNFDHNIQLLLLSYPPDYKDKNGEDFWVGSKKIPSPIRYDPNDDLSLEYVYKLIYILCHALGIEFTKEELNKEVIKKISSEIKIKEMDKELKKIDIDKEEEADKKREKEGKINSINQEKEDANDESIDNESESQNKAKIELDELLNELAAIKRENYDPKKICPEEFEKDHDENGHIDFIHAGANLRARNYKIDECDRNNTKKIAGNIIPTILTTTASIAGFASIQLYTLFQTHERKYFRNSILDLASCFYFFEEPSEPVKILDTEFSEKTNRPMKAIPEGWNKWDVIEIKGPKTCIELIDDFNKKYDVDIDMITGNGVILVNFVILNEELRKKLSIKIEDKYKEKTGKEIKKNYLMLHVGGSIFKTKIGEKTFEDVSVSIPPIKYYFK